MDNKLFLMWIRVCSSYQPFGADAGLHRSDYRCASGGGPTAGLHRGPHDPEGAEEGGAPPQARLPRHQARSDHQHEGTQDVDTHHQQGLRPRA